MQAPDATGTKNITKPDVQDCSRYLILGPERQKKKETKVKSSCCSAARRHECKDTRACAEHHLAV